MNNAVGTTVRACGDRAIAMSEKQEAASRQFSTSTTTPHDPTEIDRVHKMLLRERRYEDTHP